MRISEYARSYLRSKSTDLMEDQCRIYRPSSAKITYNPVTKIATRSSGTDVYEGVCRIWEVPAGGKFQLGDIEYTTAQLWLSIPYDAVVPETDDQVEILVSVDPELVGKYLRITSVVLGGGLRGSRKMMVEFLDKKDS